MKAAVINENATPELVDVLWKLTKNVTISQDTFVLAACKRDAEIMRCLLNYRGADLVFSKQAVQGVIPGGYPGVAVNFQPDTEMKISEKVMISAVANWWSPKIAEILL